MTTLNDSIIRIRRFLRDPGGAIWSDDDLLLWFNEAQMEIVQKTGVLERVEAHYYPGRFTWSYQNDWEWEYIEGDRYKCLMENQASGEVICYPWESGYWMSLSGTPDDGYRMTQPWESAYGTPADAIPITLHHEFHRMKFAAYDEDPITPIGQKELAEQDRWYKTRTGLVTNYYRPDEEGNMLVPYPRPATVVFQEFDYTEVLSDTGGKETYDEDYLQEKETGIALDYISTENAFLFVYESLPTELADITETPDVPSWLVRIVEHGTLERAYGADTDGFIPSLRDYWKARKEIGLMALKKFKRMRLTDRDFRLGGRYEKYTVQHPTLGEHYPRQCP
jgi:hypothetical protein